jgi:hypothetical protein
VASNTAMSIVVAGGPGDRTDWVGIATPAQPQYRNRIRLSCNWHGAAAASWHSECDLCNRIVAGADRDRELRSSVLRRRRRLDVDLARQSSVRGQQSRRSHSQHDYPISRRRDDT